MLTVNAYAATSATEPLVPTTIERRDVGPKDVLIEIRYAGICHSDIHTVRGEWGQMTYPLTVGHEIVGVVTEIGEGVSRHAVGDRVGVGCMVNSCRECAACLAGEEQYCSNGNIGTYASVDRDGSITQGGYSTHVVVDEDFVLRVPESIPCEAAAPLLCAGITTFSPLRHWKAGPGSRVAVVGLGGLGHMAVKLAHAMGAEVTVLSTSRAKEADAKRLGAASFEVTAERATFKKLSRRFDLIIDCVSAAHDLNAYLNLLRPFGAMVLVGVPPKPAPVHAFSLINGNRKLAGSSIGNLRDTQAVLDFCAQHRLGADVEVVAAKDINLAYERMVKNDVRYRFVIDGATI
jgi:uncharacterized zinc-type alcohol dehydrogenase-like protein